MHEKTRVLPSSSGFTPLRLYAINPAVRFAVPLLILALASSSMGAAAPDSDQEHRISKILHPDRTLAYYSGDHRVGGVKSFGTNSKKSTDFNLIQKFHPSGYASEKGFSGAKSDWKGDVKFKTTSAKTEGTRKGLDTSKKAATKTAATKEDWQSSKKSPTREDRYAKREFLGPQSKKVHDTTPDVKNTGWKGSLQPMTIDEVRDLLNKPKL